MSEIVEAQSAAPAHIDHIMKSGFTMNDIKGLHRSYTEDAAEADEQMLRPNPQRPPRKGSLTQNGYDSMDLNIKMQRSMSALNMERFHSEERALDDKSEKKRGRSPFNFFRKSRDQSKDKLKSKSKSPDAMDRRAACKWCLCTSIIGFE